MKQIHAYKIKQRGNLPEFSVSRISEFPTTRFFTKKIRWETSVWNGFLVWAIRRSNAEWHLVSDDNSFTDLIFYETAVFSTQEEARDAIHSIVGTAVEIEYPTQEWH